MQKQPNLINYPLSHNHSNRLREQKQVIGSMLREGGQVGEVLRLAYYRQDGEVQMDEEGLYLLQKYSNSEVAFIGFVGCEDSRNFMIDALLNVSGLTGNYFTTIYGQPQDNTILLWSLPFSCHPKTKVFLLSLSTSKVVNRKHQILFDLMMLLCSSLAVVNIPDLAEHKRGRIFTDERSKSGVNEAWLDNFIVEVKDSAKRIKTQHEDKRHDSLWPRYVTTFQPYKISQEHSEALSMLFHISSFIQTDSPLLTRNQTVQDMLLSLNELHPLISQTFMSVLSSFFIDQMQRLPIKQYESLKLSCNILCKMLINSTRYMNKKPTLKVNKIFTSIFKELYEASILYHSQSYALMLQQEFVDEEPMPYDTLLDILERLEEATMSSFNQNVIHEPVHEEYEQQLLDIIGEKEKQLIEVNLMKTRGILSAKINALHRTVQFEPEHIRNYLLQLKELVALHDHHPIEIVTHKLDKYSNNLQKRIIQERLKVEREQIAVIKKEMKERKQEYREVREAHAEEKQALKILEKAYKKELREQYKIDMQIRSIKKEIDQQKRAQKEYIILKSKETKKDTAERLLETIRELEEQVRDNDKQVEEINKEFDYHPEILALNKKIQQKERQIKNIDRLESIRASQVTPSVTKTVIQKSVVQKSVEPVPGRRTIKRVTAKSKK